MFVKVIADDKVKILVEKKDMDRFGVTADTLDDKDSASREFLLYLLDQVFKRTGVDFTDSRVLVEVISGTQNSYYIIITRLSAANETSVKVGRSTIPDGDTYIFELSELESIFDVVGIIDKFTNVKFGKTRLFNYRGNYYLSIDFSPESVADKSFSHVLSGICECGKKCKWSMINEAILCEWGTVIAENPIEQIKKAAIHA